jgi:hypothetical protein
MRRDMERSEVVFRVKACTNACQTRRFLFYCSDKRQSHLPVFTKKPIVMLRFLSRAKRSSIGFHVDSGADEDASLQRNGKGMKHE